MGSEEDGLALYRRACRMTGLDLRTLLMCGPECVGRGTQGRRPTLTPGQRRRRRRLEIQKGYPAKARTTRSSGS